MPSLNLVARAGESQVLQEQTGFKHPFLYGDLPWPWWSSRFWEGQLRGATHQIKLSRHDFATLLLWTNCGRRSHLHAPVSLVWDPFPTASFRAAEVPLAQADIPTISPASIPLQGHVGVTLQCFSTEQPHDDLTILLCPPLHHTGVLDTLPAVSPHPLAFQQHLHPARTRVVPVAAGMHHAWGCQSRSGGDPKPRVAQG